MSTTQKFSFAELAKQTKKSNSKQMFVIAECSYGDFRKKFGDQELPILKYVVTGKMTISETGEINEAELAKCELLASHKKVTDVKKNTITGFEQYTDVHGNKMGNTDGWLVCEKKHIEVLTKAIQAFNANKLVIDVKLNECITLLANVFEFHSELTNETNVETFANEFIIQTTK
jgi:hypothetical protein